VSHAATTSSVYAVLAEFENPTELLDAANKTREAGFHGLEAYTPFPVHGLTEALGHPRTKLPWLVFVGGLTGTCTGFFMQLWMQTLDYPVNIGGRPTDWGSLPSCIVVMFECTVLFAAFTAVFGMLALNGLPKPYHPVFEAKNFAEASRSRFFLSIESTDPHFDVAKAEAHLQALSPRSVSVVSTEQDSA